MKDGYCPDEDCDGLVINSLCNQCGYGWTRVVERSKFMGFCEEKVEEANVVDGGKVLRICGIEIAVKEVNLSGGHFGQASLEESEILINKDLADDLKRDTLIHEVIHIISGANALQITEEQVACLANNLAQFLEDNKDVLEY